MGMHFGVIAVAAQWNALENELPRLLGTFTDSGVVPAVSDEMFDQNGGDVAVAGEYRGSCYLLDPIMTLSAGTFDPLVDVSRRLSTTVASCAAETVSGTFSLLIARNGEAKRAYYNCASAMTAPFSVGSPLPSEARVPLEDIDGRGLFACLAQFGFDYEGWFNEGSKRLLYLGENAVAPEPGPASLDRAFKDHWERFQRKLETFPTPKVVMRRLPDGSTGFDIVADPVKPSLVARLKSWFRG